MRFFLLLTALAHVAHSGNVPVRTSNLLSPADVTYVDAAYHAGLTAGPLTYSAPAPAPAPSYAPIPTLHHLPGVADVPVTRLHAQPALIQKTVDVARPAIKTQRYEVRRPAIQKQFYDIEERVVVRPAGSAVVELDEPLSRTQKGPSVIQPTGEGVAVASSSVAVPAAPAAAPAELPSVEINLARASVPAPSVGIAAAPAPAVGIAAAPTASVGIAAAPAASVGIAAAPAPSVGIARASFAPAPSVEVRTPVPTAVAAPAPLPAVAFARAAPAAPAVEVRTSFPAQVQSAAYPVQYQSVGVSVPVKTVTGVSTVSSGASGIASVPAAPTQVTISTPAPQYQQQIIQTTPAADDSVSIDSADLARSAAYSRPPTNHHAYAAAAPRASLLLNYPNPIDVIPQQSLTPATAFSEPNYQSQINHDNQQKLIQLLTARGGVSEVGFGRSGASSYPQDAGQVRARVLSATPAPAYAAPAGERVNTRRVVVSRPIETLQEVEVAEPVTKYERHQVDQPAVVKTATQDVVRVPASVPVYGKALAPVAEAAYPAGWH